MSFSNKLGIIAIVEWLGLYTIGDNYYTERILSASCLFLIIYTIFKSFHIKRYDIFIIFAFIFNYALVPYNYYFNSLLPGVRTEALDSLIIYKVSLILHLFVSVILAYINLCVSRQFLIMEKHDLVYKMCIILGFVGTTFGLSGTNILQSGAYYGGTTNYSSVYEYSIIPITLSLIYADTKDKRNITYILYAYFVIKCLLFGGRIAAIILLIAAFLIRWQYYWSKRAILVGLFFGMLFMSVWGVFRSNTLVDFVDVFVSVSNFDSITQDGQYSDVFYASARVLYLIDIGILDTPSRIYSFILFFVSIFVPYSALPQLANLSVYYTSTYSSGGGGLAPVFFYAYSSWFGVVALAVFISYVLNKLQDCKSNYFRLYAILVVAFTPRWFAYYPIHIVKLCVYGMLFFGFLKLIQRRIKQ